MTTNELTRVILGTAGHIDHGKTALVKALTGVDTDRLKEEKARGITIELGFATLELPGGQKVSIVDVPGHERFIKNMVAGATGIDIVLFVVAADEGIMPQSREHLDICSLLEVRGGIVVLTKADLVEPDFLELVVEDVKKAVEGTFLEGAQIIPVSAFTGQGLDALKLAVAQLAKTVSPRHAKGSFRLPVDRVFTIKGFGTVVTGTSASGAIKKDDEAVILPRGITVKVRGLEVQGSQVDKAYAGSRVAMNFAGIGVDDVSRGDVVATPGVFVPTRMADARFRLLAGAPMLKKSRTKLRLHIGTREIPAVLSLLDREGLNPGETAYVQLRTAEPFVCAPGDHFVLRSYSPPATVGGGKILDSAPVKHKGDSSQVIEILSVLDVGTQLERLCSYLRLRRQAGLTPEEAQTLLDITPADAQTLLNGAVSTGRAYVADKKARRHIDAGFVDGLIAASLGWLRAYHEANPLKKGMNVEEFRGRFPSYIEPKILAFVIEKMIADKAAILDSDTIRHGKFAVQFSADDDAMRQKLLARIEGCGYEVPTLAELAQALGEEEKSIKPILDFLMVKGALVKTKEGFYFTDRLLEKLEGAVIELLAQKGEINVADMKEITGTTRKYTIPMLELLDSRKVTRRNGEVRVAGPKGKKA